MTNAAAPTTEVRPGFDFDVGPLADYLAGAVSGFRGPLELRQFSGGQSNPTYLLTTPERRYVLRRKPPGVLLASAHAVDREYRVLAALGAMSDVPVPRVLALCMDPAVIGTAFYVMDHIEGRVLRDAAFPEVGRDERPAYAEAVVDALARLHGADYRAAGLADFGREGGYLRRQFSRWSRQYAEDAEAGRVPVMDRLIEWLPAQLPEVEETCIVHGDYRCDNVIFHPHEPRVLAVLDWELATLGNPLADFGYHLMMYRMPPLAVTGLLGRDLAAMNLPDESRYVAWYCAKTGRSGIPGLDVLVAFNLFKLAAVCHGIRGRLLRGNAADAAARSYAAQVEPIAELAWAQAERAMAGTR
jgi:aminoglycoside phosphotransferase (APT) family kinase protein